MRKNFLLCFLALGLSLGAQTPADLKAPEILAIQQRGELIVAMTKADQPPFYFVNAQGNLEGLDVTLATLLAQRLEVKPVFLRDFASFNDVVDAVAQGKADIAISKLSLTLKRAQTVRFSEPYITFRQGLLFNRLQLAKVTNNDGLPGFVRNFKGKLGVIKNSSYAGYAKTNFPNAELVEFPTWGEVVSALKAGTVLAAYRDEMECRLITENDPQSALTLKLVVLRDQVDPIAMAVRWNSAQLAAFVDKFLGSLKWNLTVDQLLTGSYKKHL